MKKRSKKNIGLLAFTAIYSIIMVLILASTVFILSHEKLQSTETTKYVVETEYVYITESVSESTDVFQSTDTETVEPIETVFEALWVKEYSGKIGIFNTDGEAIHIIDVYTKTLPEADKHLLEEGFEITSEKQLASIIQDYSS